MWYFFTDCSQADLAHYFFIEIKYRYIFGHNIYKLSLSLDECKNKCAALPECRTLDYEIYNVMCTGSEQTLLTIDSYSQATSEDGSITMYQKACRP